ncbi:hypothetical protein EHM69_09470 [candidate division KSB1 bacterium]|nr:MAG: hypothetical protein EHM69_09470 [candidate division KSB1 bacterium]
MFNTIKQRELSYSSLLFILLFLWGCGGPEGVALRGGTEHLLLLDKRTLQYQERYRGETVPYTLIMRYTGGQDIRVYNLEFRGIEMGRCRLISKDQQVFFETTKPLTKFDYLPEYRQLWVDESVLSGGEWEDFDVGTNTVVAPSETVTVPAGTFSNCYKTVTSAFPSFVDSLEVWRGEGLISEEEYQQQKSAAGIAVVRWFASGVGLVKEQIGSPDHVRELVEVKRPGTGRVDIPSDESDSLE